MFLSLMMIENLRDWSFPLLRIAVVTPLILNLDFLVNLKN